MEAERAYDEAFAQGDTANSYQWPVRDCGALLPADPAEGLHVRWLETYEAGTDQILTRIDVSTLEMQMPRAGAGIWQTDPARQQFVRQHYREQFEDLCRRAREAPGEQFSLQLIITPEELWQTRPYVRLPQDYTNIRRQLPPPPNPVPMPPLSLPSDYERAEKRSLELLWDWLSDAQRRELHFEGHFTVCGEHSGRKFHISKKSSYGLTELDDNGTPVAHYCVVPAGASAVGDIMLAQKVWMETDERSTLAKANRMAAYLPANVAARPAAPEQLAQQAQNLSNPHLQYAQRLNAQADMLEREGQNATDVMRVRQRAQEAALRARQLTAPPDVPLYQLVRDPNWGPY